jgi:hypothetical protein
MASHPSSFIWSSWKVDRGRRMLPEHSSYLSNDYLKDLRPEHEKKTFTVGKSSGRHSKFKVGFFRRPAATILAQNDSNSTQKAVEERKEQSYYDKLSQRRSYLIERERRNGNIINHGTDAAHPIAPQNNDNKMFQSLRRYEGCTEQQLSSSHSLEKAGAGRFHTLYSSKEWQHRKQQNLHNLQRIKQSCSILGFGRADLDCQGVVDNFTDNNNYDNSDTKKFHRARPTQGQQNHFVVGSGRNSQQQLAEQEFQQEAEKRAKKAERHLQSQIAFSWDDSNNNASKIQPLKSRQMQRRIAESNYNIISGVVKNSELKDYTTYISGAIDIGGNNTGTSSNHHNSNNNSSSGANSNSSAAAEQ